MEFPQLMEMCGNELLIKGDSGLEIGSYRDRQAIRNGRSEIQVGWLRAWFVPVEIRLGEFR
jgi:hypothetical protein